MINYQVKYKVRTVDFYILIIFLLFSSISHFTAVKIINFPNTNIPLISATFTYMLPMSLTDLVRAYSTQRNAFKFIFIEMFFVFTLISIPYSFFLLPSPNWANVANLITVFTFAFSMFKANFVGITLMSVADIFLFSFLFNKIFKNLSIYLNFIISNIISNIFIIIIYVYVTDYEFLHSLYPNHWLIITNYNLLSNIVMIVFYSLLSSLALRFIKNFINQI